MKKIHEEFQNFANSKPCSIIPSMERTKQYKCDICYRRFEKRSKMIRHIKNVHSSDIHRVDLSTFVMPKKYQQAWTLLELS